MRLHFGLLESTIASYRNCIWKKNIVIILIYFICLYCKYIMYVSIPFFNFHILVDLLKAPDLSLLLSPHPPWHSNGYNLSGHIVEVSEFLVLRYCTNVSLLVKLSLPEAKPADPFEEHLPHQSRMCHFSPGDGEWQWQPWWKSVYTSTVSHSHDFQLAPVSLKSLRAVY